MSPNPYNPFYAKSWAIVIGINEYKLVGPLSYASNDAESIAESLVSSLNFEEKQVCVLLNKKATRSNIMATFSEIRDKANNPDDRIIFFFAGHGHTQKGIRGPVGFLIPFEGVPSNLGTLIYFDDLVKTSELIQAKHILFIMDACYGGVILKRTVQPGTQRFVRDMLQRYSRQVITAGKADEPVSDGGGPGGKNSIFTGHLIEGILGKASTPEGVLTANSLMHYVYENVGQDSRSDQTPHFGYLDGDGDLILRTPNNEHLRSDMDTDFLITVPPQVSQGEIEEGKVEARSSFVEKSGYLDVDHPSFGQNMWSSRLGELKRYTQATKSQSSAYSWLSLIAEPASQGLVEIDIAEELNRVPYPKPEDSPPYTRFAIPYFKQTTIDTAVRYDFFDEDKDLWKSYLRIDRVGNIEYAESQNVFMEFNGIRLFRYVTLIGLCWQFQFLVKEILSNNGYKSGIRFFVNIVGTRDTILTEFSSEKGEGNQVWSEPFRSGPFGDNPGLLKLKCLNPNLQIKYDLPNLKLDEDLSKCIIIDVAEKLGLAYNHQTKSRCFNFGTYKFPWNQFFQSRKQR